MLFRSRNKGKDASAVQSLSSIRSQAELYYNGDGANAYATAKPAAGIASIDAAAATAGTASVCVNADVVRLAAAAKAQTSNAVNCVVGKDGGSYIVYSSLLGAVSPANFCIDSSGYAGNLTAAPAAIVATAAVSCK